MLLLAVRVGARPVVLAPLALRAPGTLNAGRGASVGCALRGESRGGSYCSCPDFRTNTLGTCKHVMKVLTRAQVLLGELSLASSLALPPSGRAQPRIASGVANQLREALDVRVSADEQGRQRLAFSLPPRDSSAALLRGVAEALVSGAPRPAG